MKLSFGRWVGVVWPRDEGTGPRAVGDGKAVRAREAGVRRREGVKVLGRVAGGSVIEERLRVGVRAVSGDTSRRGGV